MATPTAPEKLDGGATTVSSSGAWAVIPTTVSAACLLDDAVGRGCARLRRLRHLQLTRLLGGDHRRDLALDRGEQRLLLRELRGDRLLRSRALGDDPLLARFRRRQLGAVPLHRLAERLHLAEDVARRGS